MDNWASFTPTSGVLTLIITSRCQLCRKDSYFVNHHFQVPMLNFGGMYVEILVLLPFSYVVGIKK